MRLHLALVLAVTAPLSAAPEKDGWIPLFDGTTLTGWRTLNEQPIEGWAADNGTLHFTPPKPRKKDCTIYTVKEYGDFILELEWKIAPGGNSGIKYRMNWYGNAYLGPEYQLLGQPGSPEKPRGGKGATGSLYDILPPDFTTWCVKTPGEWNTTRIVASGTRIEHWLNGKRILAVDLDSERFKQAVAKSKFRNRKNFARISGVIIDVCGQHGVWLDAGEMEKIRLFIADGGLERAQDKKIEANRVELTSLATKVDQVAFSHKLIHFWNVKRWLFGG